MSETQPDVSSDLKSYSEELLPLADEEQGLLDTYESVTGANYTDDGTTYDAIQGLIPRGNAFIAKIEAIQPSTPQLQAIHAKYVQGWNDQVEAWLLISSALENQDSSLIAQGNDKLATGRALITEFRNEFMSLK
jgi:hypothetical protein